MEALKAVVLAEKVSDEIRGFLAQQAAEKAVKAVLTAWGIHVRKTHDLRKLLDLARDHSIVVPEDILEVRTLTPFAVEFRYGDLPESSPPLDRQATIQLTARCLAWAEGELAKAAK